MHMYKVYEMWMDPEIIMLFKDPFKNFTYTIKQDRQPRINTLFSYVMNETSNESNLNKGSAKTSICIQYWSHVTLTFGSVIKIWHGFSSLSDQYLFEVWSTRYWTIILQSIPCPHGNISQMAGQAHPILKSAAVLLHCFQCKWTINRT